MDNNKVKKLLDEAQEYADNNSGCRKVAVGCVLICKHAGTTVEVYGANRAIPDLCKSTECQRIQLYGEDSKNHRLPSDCRAIHSEVDAITHCARCGINTKGATAIVTRYPCEACARALISAGVTDVYYGREQEISDQTRQMFKTYGVNCRRIASWTYDDTSR